MRRHHGTGPLRADSSCCFLLFRVPVDALADSPRTRLRPDSGRVVWLVRAQVRDTAVLPSLRLSLMVECRPNGPAPPKAQVREDFGWSQLPTRGRPAPAWGHLAGMATPRVQTLRSRSAAATACQFRAETDLVAQVDPRSDLFRVKDGDGVLGVLLLPAKTAPDLP